MRVVPRQFHVHLGSVLASAALLVLCASAHAAGGLEVSVLSSRPDMVSGGDALMRIKIPGAAAGLAVTLNGRDITASFHDSSAGAKEGLVEGLPLGKSVLRASVGRAQAKIELTNYPVTGPILSGPHMTPYVCNTSDAGLGPALDSDCSAPTKIEYFYQRRGATDFQPLPDPRVVPADVAQATVEGRQVPFIVRVESGTINRGIYRIAILDNPGTAAASGWKPGPGWNHRLIISFGAGGGANYNQGRSMPQTVLNAAYLSRGFAHMSSTQLVMSQHANDALAGEATMMLKEHFIERYGVPLWTSGAGGSGGAMMQYLVAQNYPGLLDGIMPSQSFTDFFTNWIGNSDCRLLLREFAAHPENWPADARQAASGVMPGKCEGSNPFIDANIASNRNCGIPPEMIYDAEKNPKGARCTVFDMNVNTLGRAADGHALRTFDNVGVQYGLQGLKDGTLSPAQFVQLNSGVGGFDRDGNLQPTRTAADSDAVRRLYAAGRVNSGGGSLGTIPIMNFRPYVDDTGNIHDRIRDFSIRERLRQTPSRGDNLVEWVYPPGAAGAMVPGLVIDTMTKWLDAVVQDNSADPLRVKVLRARPAEAVDACWDKMSVRINEPVSLKEGVRCNALYPPHSNPRLVAGDAVKLDTVKCQLKPLSRSDYPAAFTDEQWQTLSRVFPTGVCNYSKPGVQKTALAGTYLRLPLR